MDILFIQSFASFSKRPICFKLKLIRGRKNTVAGPVFADVGPYHNRCPTFRDRNTQPGLAVLLSKVVFACNWSPRLEWEIQTAVRYLTLFKTLSRRVPGPLSESFIRLHMIRVATTCQVGIFAKFFNFLLLIHQTQTHEDLSYFYKKKWLVGLWRTGQGGGNGRLQFKSQTILLWVLTQGKTEICV